MEFRFRLREDDERTVEEIAKLILSKTTITELQVSRQHAVVREIVLEVPSSEDYPIERLTAVEAVLQQLGISLFVGVRV